MSKLWRLLPHQPERIARLERAAGVPAVVAQLLLARGICELEDVRTFLDPKLSGLREPSELPGAEQAASRLAAAVRDNRRICVYGDYDVDGMTGCAILYRCLQMLGATVRYHVPCRLNDGYGLHSEALEQIARDGADLVVTVDCGIGAVEQAETAARLGLELIITDHHTMSATLPQAAVIVHPQLPGYNYPFHGLCGSAVAFKVAWALCQQMSGAKRVSPVMREFLLQATVLAALGTVADVVPLLDENRILVRHGLIGLKKHSNPGLQALMRVTGLADKPALESEDIGFGIAPRLNAAGRLGQARLAVELLTTPSDSRAMELAQYIDQLNSSRQSLERSIYLAAKKQIKELCDEENDPAFVLAGRGWHAGVIGIVAGRLAEKFHRPVVVISQDELGVKPGAGSARSVPGFNLHAAFESCTHRLLGHGGHAAAAGLKIADENLEAFREEFCEYVAAEIKPEQQMAELLIDAETPLGALTYKTVRQIDQLAPFGKDNARPVLCASSVRLAAPPKRMGGGERHLSVMVEQHGVRLRGVSFGNGDWAEELAQHDGLLDIAFRAKINTFRGQSNVEIELADWKPAAVENGNGAALQTTEAARG